MNLLVAVFGRQIYKGTSKLKLEKATIIWQWGSLTFSNSKNQTLLKKKMQKIQKNGTTSLIVTVTELTTIPNPNYLFEFIHEQSFDNQTCVLTNISQGIPRFDEFVLIDGVNVNFIYDGYYIYNIYQQSSPGNLDPVNSQGLVETGRAHVVEVDSPSYEYDSPIYFNIYE